MGIPALVVEWHQWRGETMYHYAQLNISIIIIPLVRKYIIIISQY